MKGKNSLKSIRRRQVAQNSDALVLKINWDYSVDSSFCVIAEDLMQRNKVRLVKKSNLDIWKKLCEDYLKRKKIMFYQNKSFFSKV